MVDNEVARTIAKSDSNVCFVPIVTTTMTILIYICILYVVYNTSAKGKAYA